MQHLKVRGAVRHIYVIRQLKGVCNYILGIFNLSVRNDNEE